MQKSFYEAIKEHMEGMVKHLGSLGPRKDLGDVQEIRCLNRVIRWVKSESGDRVEWEPDPRHVEILVYALFGDKVPKKLSSPGEKTRKGRPEPNVR